MSPACTSWACPGSTPAVRPCSASSTMMPPSSLAVSPPATKPGTCRARTLKRGAKLKMREGRAYGRNNAKGVAWRCPAGGGYVMRVCIVGASGKLGQYMVQHALDRGYEVVGVCREQSVEKLGRFRNRISIVHGATDDRDVIKRAVAGCDAVLTVLVPRGLHQYASGT